ncbi:tyrosine--tRNA ligase [Desulfosarcina ovata subsp. sediminis]|uniref:Tyrosine--tRNA ligase n=1 Tax=Desulfosarcina ovata subsp. sediminis TaxID=885957 RepID=A0A5K7ZZM8_9BACT|nr:tyrosine--tRNA ligase [Desulfosarcina ovata]BBO85658.1 tyrosine--tRNA ligase [Desulfosarcina ovata subsp. sediminis]
MENVLDVLRKRGFIEQTTHDEELRDYLDAQQITCYIGFDPTASSLHVGSLVPIMSLAHMQRCGHRPIALVGGGTGLVGDPSGKTEMRKLLTVEDVATNVTGLKNQLSRFIDFSNEQAIMVNNADWLTQLAYIPFLRDIGRHFSVNRMIKAESYKMRLDSDDGLSFIEFNYMVLQAYDFLELRKRYGCCLQMGGSDQWGNIVAGIDLIRRVEGKSAFGITFPLITTASGAKMGKTAAGAVWLDPDRTSPYDYYQFWVNTDDRDVSRFLALFTFLPMDEIAAVESLEGADLNAAKAILAYEATRLAHGEVEARSAYQAAMSMFGSRQLPEGLLPSSTILRVQPGGAGETVPQIEMSISEFETGVPCFKLFHQVGLADSSGAARRLIQQGGGYVNGRRLASIDEMVTSNDINGMEILLRAGKKHFFKIRIKK